MSKSPVSAIKYSRINAQAASPSNDIGILEEFRIEFLRCWSILPNKAFFLILLGLWLLLFQFVGNSTLGFIHSPSLLYWMYSVYQPSEMYDDGHARFIPVVVLGILWWKRKELLALPLRTWWPGLLILLFGLMLHLLGYRVQQPRISIVGLFTGIYGLTGMAWGPQWLRRTFFPFVLFVFCIPLGTFIQAITFPLRMMVSKIVEAISHNLLAIDVLRDGTTLRDPTGHYGYDVAAACSGIRSLIATVVFAIVYSMMSFRTWWRRGVLVAVAIPLAVAGNVLRMLAIVMASEWIDPSWGHTIHEGGPLGIWSLLPYVPPFFGLIWLGQKLHEPDSGASGTDAPVSKQPSSVALSTSSA